ncbi:MAG: hypothetical protein GX240_00345 [Candidatus Atribacteria bacterium]|jgi:hypothetical protein|nr:hypothetical protein [Candidatus Atribacteria bacterium]
MKNKAIDKEVGIELLESESKTEDLILFDNTDKPFLVLYLFIFIFGIILTVISI